MVLFTPIDSFLHPLWKLAILKSLLFFLCKKQLDMRLLLFSPGTLGIDLAVELLKPPAKTTATRINQSDLHHRLQQYLVLKLLPQPSSGLFWKRVGHTLLVALENDMIRGDRVLSSIQSNFGHNVRLTSHKRIKWQSLKIMGLTQPIAPNNQSWRQGQHETFTWSSSWWENWATSTPNGNFLFFFSFYIIVDKEIKFEFGLNHKHAHAHLTNL